MRGFLIAAFMAIVGVAGAAAVTRQAASTAAPAVQGESASPAREGGAAGAGADREYIPGWAMMSRSERDALRHRMLNVSGARECRQVRDEHLNLMAERARARGTPVTPAAGRDPCATFAR